MASSAVLSPCGPEQEPLLATEGPISVATTRVHQPVRFRIIAYGNPTTQAYDGADATAARAVWKTVEHGMFLGVDESHVWTTIERRA